MSALICDNGSYMISADEQIIIFSGKGVMVPEHFPTEFVSFNLGEWAQRGSSTKGGLTDDIAK